MSKDGFVFTGIEDLDKSLSEFARKTVKRIVTLGLKKGAENTRQVAEDLAPVKSGRTKENLHINLIRRNKKYFGWNVQVGGGDWRGNDFYAGFVEMGHHLGKAGNLVRYLQRHKQGDAASLLDRRKWLEGKHWLFHAFRATLNESRDIAIDTIRQGIERELKRQAKKAARQAAT
jgi:hypothetical protein